MTALIQFVWRLLRQAMRVVLFILLFLLATINSSPVEFHWFVDRTSQIPLNVLLLSSFLLGLFLAIMSLKLRRSK